MGFYGNFYCPSPYPPTSPTWDLLQNFAPTARLQNKKPGNPHGLPGAFINAFI